MKEILETVFLLAGIQGILLSIILFTRKENHNANIVLAFASFTLSCDLFTVLYYQKEFYLICSHFSGITYPLPYLYGPLFYIYTKLVSKSETKFGFKNLLHFTPVIIIYLISIPVFLYSGAEKIGFINKMILNEGPLVFKIIGWIVPFQGIVYTILTIKTVSDYNKKIKDSFSNIDKINLGWLKYLAIGTVTIWTIVAVVYLVHIISDYKTDIGYMLHFSISILIYSVGYFGLKQPEIFMRPQETESTEEKYEKYKNSGLDETASEQIKNKLIDVMNNEKPYLDSDLTLNKLAEILSVSNHHLSEVINTKLNQNYYDFINKYRIDEFINKLKDPANDKYSLISLAFDSGFKSKTSFNTIFKKLTNKTPSEYKGQLISLDK